MYIICNNIEYLQVIYFEQNKIRILRVRLPQIIFRPNNIISYFFGPSAKIPSRFYEIDFARQIISQERTRNGYRNAASIRR